MSIQTATAILNIDEFLDFRYSGGDDTLDRIRPNGQTQTATVTATIRELRYSDACVDVAGDSNNRSDRDVRTSTLNGYSDPAPQIGIPTMGADACSKCHR